MESFISRTKTVVGHNSERLMWTDFSLCVCLSGIVSQAKDKMTVDRDLRE